MSKTERTKLPEVIAFAGPNGSGKSTITSIAQILYLRGLSFFIWVTFR